MPLVTALDGRVYEVSEELLEKSQIADNDVTKLDTMSDLPEAPPVVPGPPPMPGRVQVSGGESPYVNVKPGPNNGVIIEVSPPNARPQ